MIYYNINILSLPYDPRLPSISRILHRRHQALLMNDPNAREYMAEPPMVTYTRGKNLRDLVFRAKVPGPLSDPNLQVFSSLVGQATAFTPRMLPPTPAPSPDSRCRLPST